MWAAAEAVNEMCVTKGGAGAAFGLGESEFLGSLVSRCALLMWRRDVGQNKRLMLSLIP